jgi:mRNA-degrading endonuclease toxin of MazEF toxin-antitoxin module
MKNNTLFNKGQIWEYTGEKFDIEDWNNSELVGNRPVIIYQSIMDIEYNSVIVIPLSSYKNQLMNGVKVNIDDKDGYARVGKMRSVPINQLTNYRGSINTVKLAEIDDAVSLLFGMTHCNQYEVNKCFPKTYNSEMKISNENIHIVHKPVNQTSKNDKTMILSEIENICNAKSKINYKSLSYSMLFKVSNSSIQIVANMFRVTTKTAKVYISMTKRLLELCSKNCIMDIFTMYPKLKDIPDNKKYIYIKIDPRFLSKYLNIKYDIVNRYHILYINELNK